jgi:hypothetical protein
MKKIYSYSFIGALLVLTSVVSFAQDCTLYYPSKKGTEITMKSYDEKDKLTSMSTSKIIDVTGGTIQVESEVFDAKEKSMGKSTFNLSCKDGEFVVDLSGYLKGVNMDAYKDMEVKVETEDMHMPGSLKAGDVLDDGEMTMKISNQGFTFMTIKVKVYNRKVEAIENVTTPAGTFECAKISYDIDTKVGIAAKFKGIEWTSKNVGVVKSESYNSKGKLQGYTLLTSLK